MSQLTSSSATSPLGNISRFTYSLVCYLLSVASLIYFILFVNDLLLAKTVNSVTSIEFSFSTFSINLLALSLFALQHSIMARQRFKDWLTHIFTPIWSERPIVWQPQPSYC